MSCREVGSKMQDKDGNWNGIYLITAYRIEENSLLEKKNNFVDTDFFVTLPVLLTISHSSLILFAYTFELENLVHLLNIRHITSQHINSQYITIQHISSLHNTSHHITSQHISSQHITSQHITSQHNTTHHNKTGASIQPGEPIRWTNLIHNPPIITLIS